MLDTMQNALKKTDNIPHQPVRKVSWQTSDVGCSAWLCRCPPWSHPRCGSGSASRGSPEENQHRQFGSFLVNVSRCVCERIGSRSFDLALINNSGTRCLAPVQYSTLAISAAFKQ